MKKGIVAGAIVVAVIAVIGIGGFLLTPSQSSTQTTQNTQAMPSWASNAMQSAQNAKNSATNESINKSGIKEAVNKALLNHSSDIAAQTGLSQSDVTQAINQMDIPDWSVTSTPANAQVQSTKNVSADGISAQVTTYSDPSIVGISGMGQNITFSVPSSAQPYVGYLQYLS